MKKLYRCMPVVLLLLPVCLWAQTANDILSNGVRVHANEVRLKLENNVLKIKSVTDRLSSYVSLDPNAYYLSGSRTNVFLVQLNPLNYSFNVEVTQTDDAISKAEDDALGQLITFFTKVNGTGSAPAVAGPGGAAPTFASIQTQMDDFSKALDNDNKKAIGQAFLPLKDISFDNLPDADEKLKACSTAIGKFKETYQGYKETADAIQGNIKKYDEPGAPPAHDTALAKPFLRHRLTKLNELLQSQLKWLASLQAAYDLVNKARHSGRILNEELVVPIQEIAVQGGKITNLKLVINQDGLKLSDDNDIVAVQKTALSTQTLKFRKYKLFVFETSAGVIYTLLDYPKYEAAPDASGQLVVTDAGNESFKRFNVASMFNWNLYTHSNIVPFFQIGIGANAEYPALFTGVGIKLNSDGGRHFALSVGFASSWIKTLNTLQLNSKVTSQADIDKDVTHQFQWPLKPYFGVQYNF